MLKNACGKKRYALYKAGELLTESNEKYDMTARVAAELSRGTSPRELKLEDRGEREYSLNTEGWIDWS